MTYQLTTSTIIIRISDGAHIPNDPGNRTFKVSEKQFLDSHRYYQSDFEGQRVRLDSIKVLIETEKRRVQEFRRNNEQTN